MHLTLGEVARLLEADLTGDAERTVAGVAGLREAGGEHVSFLANPRYHEEMAGTRAAAVIVAPDYAGPAPCALLRVRDPYGAFVRVLKTFHPEPRPEPGVHPRAEVSPEAELGSGVSVGALALVEAGARVGEGTVVGPQCFIGRGVRIGSACRLHPRVTLLPGTVLGDRVAIHSGTVIGSDGFGYASGSGGHEKIPQVGGVYVADDVEIGANAAVDRGTMGDTRIGRGVKIDNLVHIAHNVVIGDHTIIVAQVGISGSTRVGPRAVIAGQAGLVGHITVGEGVRVGAQAGVTKSIPAGSTVSGYPAMEHERAKRLHAHLRRLPQLAEQVREMEERLRDLETPRGDAL